MDIKFVVMSDYHGVRLDLFLAAQCPDYSRSRISALLKEGAILVGDERKKASYKVSVGDIVSGSICSSNGDEGVPVPQPIQLSILYKDSHILVIDKPPGMVVHPAPGNTEKTLVNALLDYCPEISSVGDDFLRPGIVHRLDRDTSGVMVVALTNPSFEFLKKEFMFRRVEKKYLAFISGNLEQMSGRVVMPIGRHPVKRKMMSVVNEAERGRYAETIWRVLERHDGTDLVEAELKTGRTHQIRVHFKALGHPLIGDSVYGFKSDFRKRSGGLCQGGQSRRVKDIYNYDIVDDMKNKAKRHLLHAWKLSFRHPWTGRRMFFTAPVPEDMRKYMRGELLINPHD
ncbi:RluD1 [Desulfamplus magnetovallimortis]|uniref:Pseudouridine synthase n=1 Tax=Desulfamplus magnetovallimortis TaxID=1246637 RepID=A0A1W1H993_9BACT|nr:RluA family pseudouridine synthase [Desulfamplus magnetovallimortis]SLM29032.1 RluD1 [Desulfamplus magnetovallimortis]